MFKAKLASVQDDPADLKQVFTPIMACLKIPDFGSALSAFMEASVEDRTAMSSAEDVVPRTTALHMLVFRQVPPSGFDATCYNTLLAGLCAEFKKKGLIDLRNGDAKTALHVACHNGNALAAYALMSAGASHLQELRPEVYT